MSNFNFMVIEGTVSSDPSDVGDRCHIYIASEKTGFDKSGLRISETVNVLAITEGRLADNCRKYLKKGNRVLLSGQLGIDLYRDYAGDHHQRVCIMAKEVNFLCKEIAHENHR